MEVDSDCCEEEMETDEENDNILKGEMLGDRDIMKAQSLLKIQFPGIDGLLAPTLGPAGQFPPCLLYTSPSPRDQRGSRMPSSA